MTSLLLHVLDAPGRRHANNLVVGRTGSKARSRARIRRILERCGQSYTTTLDSLVITIDGNQFWDTLGAQLTKDATASRGFHVSARDLGSNLAAFKRDLVARKIWTSTMVVVMSEFGPKVRENGSAGTTTVAPARCG